MRFDLATLNWIAVGSLSAMVLIASIIGETFSLGSRIFGQLLTTIVSAAIYVFWINYPHGLLPGLTVPR